MMSRMPARRRMEGCVNHMQLRLQQRLTALKGAGLHATTLAKEAAQESIALTGMLTTEVLCLSRLAQQGAVN